jgi:hypothetical protein
MPSAVLKTTCYSGVAFREMSAIQSMAKVAAAQPATGTNSTLSGLDPALEQVLRHGISCEC